MSAHEARKYVDLIVEELRMLEIISEMRYGQITEDQLGELADKVAEKSEE